MNRTRALIIACATLVPGVATAETLIHLKAEVYGCHKARAARAINNTDDYRQSDGRWVAYVVSDGQCVRITSHSSWAVTGADDDGVTLISYRGTIGKPGSYYVPTSEIDFASGDAFQDGATPSTTPPEDAATAPTNPVMDTPASTQPSAALPPGTSTAPTPQIDQAPSTSDTAPTLNPATVAPQAPTPLAPLPPTDGKELEQIKADIARVDVAPAAPSGSLPIFLIVVLVIGTGLYFKFRWRATKRARLLTEIRQEVEYNLQALRVKRIHTVQRDEFGTISWKKWSDAKEYYISTRIIPILMANGYSEIPSDLTGVIDNLIEEAATSNPISQSDLDQELAYSSSPETFDARMNPLDYEGYCAMQLQKAGWDARMTVATGDQGADVIAKQNGKTLVVQCKLYSNPVGNDAVQQVHAAKTFQSASYAAVVSNQPYTRSARQLASVNGVYLLHHDELRNFRPQKSSQSAV
jgi:restriction system protein